MRSIRDIISSAKSKSDSKKKLLEFVAQRRPHLHNSILLPSQNDIELLANFVDRYISHVPDFIEATEQMICEAKIDKDVGPILTIISNYFISPPEIINPSKGLVTLLDEAYLAHRLLEEINDRFMAKTGIPLTPMDNTTANLIAHELIGEPFANLLDQAVLFSAEMLLSEHKMDSSSVRSYIKTHQNRGWAEEIKRWPCLTDQLEIALQFPENTSALH